MITKSPALESHLAIKRATNYYKEKERAKQHFVARDQLHHVLMKGKTVNAKNIQKLMRIAKVKCPHANKISAINSHAFCVELVDADTGFQVGYGFDYDDSFDWAYDQDAILLERHIFSKGNKVVKSVVVSMHALKRLFERFPEYRQKTNDEITTYLLDRWYDRLPEPQKQQHYKARDEATGITAVVVGMNYNHRSVVNMVKTFYHTNNI